MYFCNTTTPHMDHNTEARWEYLVLYLIPIGTIWGNVLVCLAVYLERRLRHRFNLFLVSLAISDLMCATLVMPHSAWQMIQGGNAHNNRTLCLVWYSMDIFFTATTIIHLCNISLDRYLALRRPFGKYVRSRAHRILNSLVGRIVLSWFIPFSIAGPLFLVALRQQEQQEVQLERNQTRQIALSSTQTATVAEHNRLECNGTCGEGVLDGTTHSVTESYKGCGPNDPLFVLSAIGITFVLPLIIMAVTYVLTVRQLRSHVKQIMLVKLHRCETIRPKHTKPSSTYHTLGNITGSNPTRFATLGYRSKTNQSSNQHHHHHHHIIRDSNTPTVKDDGWLQQHHDTDNKPLVKRYVSQQQTPKKNGCSKSGRKTEQETGQRRTLSSRDSGKHDSITEFSGYDNSGTTGQAILQEKNSSEVQPGHSPTNTQHRHPIQRLQRINTPSTRSLASERIHHGQRAMRVIAVLFGLFVACYLPFFVVYLIDVFCVKCKRWTNTVIPHLEWLGYLSSMLNPVVYHSFNSTFRNTFRRMMLQCSTCCCPAHFRRHTEQQELRMHWFRHIQ